MEPDHVEMFDNETQDFIEPESTKAGRTGQIVYLPTEKVYAQWASVYDTDGNFLQATDDLELREELPRFLLRAGVPLTRSGDVSGNATDEQKIVVDLGCGTGRNTFKIRALMSSTSTAVIGVDSSEQMLDIAKRKAKESIVPQNSNAEFLRFERFDINDPSRTFGPSLAAKEHTDVHEPAYPQHPGIPKADAIVSTLVIEHLELEQYFSVASRLLRPGGFLLLTNMHSEMGNISQAGFVDDNGVKIRPESIPHSIEDVCAMASKHGFFVLEKKERAITNEDVEILGARSRKWVGIKCWFSVSFGTEGSSGHGLEV